MTDQPAAVPIEPVEIICMCLIFKLWYVTRELGVRVCWCGHPGGEHLDNAGSCIGVSWRDVQRVEAS